MKQRSVNRRTAQSRKSREKKGKQLNFNKETPEMPESILQGRRKEWDNYKTLDAARVVSAEIASSLMEQGASPIDMQWIDVDKNAHKAKKKQKIKTEAEAMSKEKENSERAARIDAYEEKERAYETERRKLHNTIQGGDSIGFKGRFSNKFSDRV